MVIHFRKISKRWLGVFFICLHFVVYAQHSHLRFTQLASQEGLSQITIKAIVQDKYGFMWFATHDGLNRYNGYEFKVYKNNPLDPNTISDSYTSCLFKDHLNNLWIGTPKGLHRYDYNKESFIKAESNFQDSLSMYYSSIKVIYEMESMPGILWLGTNNGLISYDMAKQIFTIHELSHTTKTHQINALYEAPYDPGKLWIGCKNGLFMYEIESQNAKKINPANSGLNNTSVNAIFEDLNRNFWIGTNAGLHRFEPEKKTSTLFIHSPADKSSLANNNITAIYQDSKKNLWIGTLGGGLHLHNNKEDNFTHFLHKPEQKHSISSNRITKIFEDESGILWIGTATGGVNKLNFSKYEIAYYFHNPQNPNSIIGKSVQSLIVDKKGWLWVGSNNGISCIENSAYLESNQSQTAYRHYLHGKNISEIFEDQKGNYWAATKFHGLWMLEVGQRKFKEVQLYNEDLVIGKNVYIRTIFEDDSNIMWFGTNSHGLFRYDPQSNNLKRYQYKPSVSNGLLSNKIYAIISDRKQELWLASGNGLLAFDSKHEVFRNYADTIKSDKGLGYQRVISVYEDRQGLIWAGTPNGLYKFNKSTGSFKRYHEKDGLTNPMIYAIVEDTKNNLWLSTNKGISIFNPLSEKFKNLGLEDGLQDYEYNSNASFRDRDGLIYFGGINGFNIINPQRVSESNRMITTVIYDFHLFNESVQISDTHTQATPLTKSILETRQIELNYDQNIFSFSYAALDYNTTQKNNYAYFLEGLEKNWNYVGKQRIATYSHIPPGKYIFRVKASDEDGNWYENTQPIRIKIRPPFWATWPFKSLIVSVLMLLLFFYYKFRIRSIESQNRKLEKTVLERTLEIREQKDEILSQNEEIVAQNEEIKAQRDELNKHRKLLEKKVEERTHKYLIAKEKAEIADNLKTKFLENLSHEVRTPLNAIIGFSDLLKNHEDLPESLTDYTNLIHTSGEALTRIVEALMTLSKIQVGEFEIFNKELRIDNLLQQLFVEFELSLSFQNKNQVEFLFNIEDIENLQITSDESVLHIILSNLIENAIKFTDAGKIEFGATKKDKALQIYVRDTGIGIAEDKLSEVFDNFKKLANDHVTLYGGLGLGLTISKHLAVRIGAELNVTSQLHAGSAFTLSIPLED